MTPFPDHRLPGSLSLRDMHTGKKTPIIMPVEDERIVARDLQSRLRRLGYDVPRIASSKDEAIAFVEQEKPDLILMDITLDGVPEGIDAAREIRVRYDIPVIYLTAHSDSDTLERAKLTEPFGYVLKPFEDRELLATIETALYKHEAEKRVRLAERWLTATLRSIGDAVIATDEDGRISFMNRIAEDLTGWNSPDAHGQELLSVLKFVEGGASATMERSLARVRRTCIPSALTDPMTLVALDGRQRFISDSLAPIVDEHGRNIGFVLVFRDVTERELYQREIAARGEQQAASNALAQRALAGLALPELMNEACASAHRVLQVDGCEIAELTPQGPHLRCRSGQVPGGHVEVGSRTSAVIGAGAKPYGTIHVYSCAPREFTNHERDFLQAIAYTIYSAVERTRAEAELRESHALLDAVFSTLTDAVLVCDAEGIIVRTNPAATEFFGFNGTGMAAPDMVEKFGLVGGISASATQQALQGASTVNVEQSAGTRHVESSAAPLRAESGNILGAVTIFRDITERKRAEERLREAQKLESIAVMAGGIAHDFNNLLAIVMGNASLALERGSSSDNIRSIIVATERAAELTRQLLAYSGQGRFVSELVDLSEMVSGSQELVRASIPRKVHLELTLADRLPPVEADPAQLRQVLVNLVINASEAIPPQRPGFVTVRTGSRVVDAGLASQQTVYAIQPGTYVLLEVQDNGTGIESPLIPRIFEPFFTTKFTGRGLGLAAVQGLARAHGGFVEVDSEPGRGATFRVFLPASQKERAQPPPPAPPPAAHRGSGTILVVDDEEMLRKMAAFMLASYGYQVLQAANGRDALDVLSTAPVQPSVMLLDVSMPEMGGDELLPILESKYPRLKVILSSGYGEENVSRSVHSPSVMGFLHKPYAGDALTAMIEKALS